MLMDLVMELVVAVGTKAKERAYKRLEKVGVDRRTADLMVAEFWNGEDNGEVTEDRS